MLNKESYSSKAKIAIKNTTQASAYAKGAIDIASNANINIVKTAWDNVNNFEKLYSIKEKSGLFFSFPTFPTQSLETKYWNLVE